MPFMHSANVFPLTFWAAICAIKSGRFCERMEMQISSLSSASRKFVVMRTSSSNVTRPLVRVRQNCSMCLEPSRPYSVTSCPILRRYHAINEPQRPQPMTVAFINLVPFHFHNQMDYITSSARMQPCPYDRLKPRMRSRSCFLSERCPLATRPFSGVSSVRSMLHWVSSTFCTLTRTG